MQITLNYTGVIDIKKFADGAIIDIAENTTIADVLDLCGVSKEHQRFIVPIVNGDESRLTRMLQDGDELSLFLPVGGG